MQIIGKAGGREEEEGEDGSAKFITSIRDLLPSPAPQSEGREGERGSLEKAQSPVLAEILTALVIKALVLENRLCLSAEID